MFSLKNKITLVTGAGSGIGASIAEVFAQAGAHVFVADRDAKGGQETVARIQASQGAAEFLPLDVSREDDCEQARPLYPKAQAALDEAGKRVRTVAGRASLDSMRAQVRGLGQACN